MPWAAGSFTETGSPLVDGEIAEATGSATALAPKLTDICEGITDTIHRGGSNSPTANIPFGGFKITGLAAGTSSGDSVRYEQVMLLAGATMTGALVLDNDGDATTPDLAFAGDLDTGIYSSAADTINITTGGTVRVTLNTTQATLSGCQLLGDNAASASAPDYSFDGDANTGMYSAGADQINWATGGTLRKSLSTTAETNTLVTLGPNGAASAPTYSFSADTNTGMYGNGSDALLFATAGSARWAINSSGSWVAQGNLGIVTGSGSAAFPAIAFDTTDFNCGLYRIGNDNIGFSAGGNLVFDYNATRLLMAIDVVLADAGPTSTLSAGFRGCPQNTSLASADYTLVLGDAGKHLYHTDAGTDTLTIPANASVAFPIGTVVIVVNGAGAGNLSIAITSDTLQRSDGTAGTGTRTVAASSTVQLLKVGSTTWHISGSGIS